MGLFRMQEKEEKEELCVEKPKKPEKLENLENNIIFLLININYTKLILCNASSVWLRLKK